MMQKILHEYSQLLRKLTRSSVRDMRLVWLFLVVLSAVLLLVVLLSVVLQGHSSIAEDPSRNQYKDQLQQLEKEMKTLGSMLASPAEKAALIRSGLRKMDDLLKHPVHHSHKAFDCKIRKLAYDFAKKLKPGKGDTQNFKAIFDALHLSSCGISFNAPSVGKRTDYGNVRYLNELDIYVGQSNRNKGDGTLENPFSDVQLAIDSCKSLRVDDSAVCRVFLRQGVYRVQKPITVSGNNIHVLAYPGETPRITSDVTIVPTWRLYSKKMETYKGFNPLFEGIKPNETTAKVLFVGVLRNAVVCEDHCAATEICTSFAFFDGTTKEFTNHCYIRLDGRWNTIRTSGVVSGKKVTIYSADLARYHLDKVESIFINDRRAIRARFPNANPETMGLHTTPTGYVNNAVKWLPPRKMADAVEVHIAAPHRKATLFPTFQLGIGGPVHQFDPPQSYWGTKKPVGGGGETYKVPSGLEYSGELEMSLRHWRNASTGIVHAMQHYWWANWMFKLDKRDEKWKTLHWSWGGFQEARGFLDGKEWYVENIFEELDSPNEWFYDQVSKVLYYSPNTTETELPNEISIPQLPCLFRVVGTQSRPVVGTVVDGVIFQHTTKTFLQKYLVPSGGDWSVHKNAMIYIEGSENTVVRYCTLDSPDGNGIMLSGYNRGSLISHNELFRLGDNGIVLLGDTYLIDGTRGNQPRGIKVLYNLVYENGIWGKQTYPFVQSRSCESYLEGNVFFNGPRAGININDGFGGGNIINSNLLFNFVRETCDHGPINTWDRVPYLTKMHDGKTASLDIKLSHIHGNFLINNYRSVWPIDHDDGSCFWNDTNNYLVYGGFKNYLAHSITSMYNVYVYPDRNPGKGASFTYPFCVQTLGQSVGTVGYGDKYQHNKCIVGHARHLYSLGACRKSHLHQVIPNLNSNQYYTPHSTFTVKCGYDVWNLKQFRQRGMEVDSVIQDLVDDDEVIQWGRNLLRM